MLRGEGVHTALISDHQHYWEDGGATYHTRYSTWQFNRGQEGDPWIGQVAPEPAPANAYGRNAQQQGSHGQDLVNRRFMQREEDQPQSRTFAAGIDFIERNHTEDNWFLQLETFDPHEPFYTQRKYKDLYPDHYRRWTGPQWDWPAYEPVQEDQRDELVGHMRYQYASLVSMCDSKLGDVLDAFDRLNLWDDTMLIVWTDHGFLLGEHDWWAKMRMPWFNTKANTPFFVWDPRPARDGVDIAGQRRQALVQPAIDLGPTLLEFFGLDPTPDMTGKVLRPAIADDDPVRDAAIFGCHGSAVNVTDGRYAYMRGSGNEHNRPLYNYTLMPTHMRSRFSPAELSGRTELVEPFRFTKGCPLMRIGAREPEQSNVGAWNANALDGHRLYDLGKDPEQLQPIHDPDVEQRLIGQMVQVMQEADAPREQFVRLGIEAMAEAAT
jgi:arylsulfatase A-like enzyme